MKKFKQIYIEITNKCNLRCSFCPNECLEKKEMSLDQFELIINMVRKYTETVCLHIQGEPLIHSNFKDVVRICYEHGLMINLTTNGTLVNKLIDVFQKYRNFKKINISLQALVNYKKESRNSYIENIDYFLNYKNKFFKEIPVNLRLWNDKSIGINVELNDYCKKHFEHMVVHHHITNTRISENDEFEWPTLDMEDNKILSSCLGGKDQLGILVDGRVVLCCLDYLGHTNLGNIFENDLECILNSEKFLNCVKGFNDRKPYLEICRKCTYRNRFIK